MAIVNIPYTYPREKLMADLDAEGLSYDYLHLPQDSRKGRNRGFAFVNFTTAEAAQEFKDKFQGRLLACAGDEKKRVEVKESELQGLEVNARLHPLAATHTTMQLGRARV